MSDESNCPTCDSRDPARHPAMQFEGEVQICEDPWHGGAVVKNAGGHAVGHICGAIGPLKPLMDGGSSYLCSREPGHAPPHSAKASPNDYGHEVTWFALPDVQTPEDTSRARPGETAFEHSLRTARSTVTGRG